MEGVHFLMVGSLPLRKAEDKARQFIRDPDNFFPPDFAPGFASGVLLPPDAVDTGFRNDGIALWSSADGSSIFLVGSGPGAGERWPVTPYAVVCD